MFPVGSCIGIDTLYCYLKVVVLEESLQLCYLKVVVFGEVF